MMEYNAFRYLYPPRPEYIITSDRLKVYEKDGWTAQYKKNGTCSLVVVGPNNEFHMMDRHAETQKMWKPSLTIIESVRKLCPRDKWTVLVAEGLHNKTPTIKDTLYFFDIIVKDSVYLTGTTFLERQAMLEAMFPANAESYSHYVTTDKIWRAKLLTKNFLKTFRDIKDPKIDEGLVLKKPTAKLDFCDKEKSNAGWQLKIRYATKNYFG